MHAADNFCVIVEQVFEKLEKAGLFCIFFEKISRKILIFENLSVILSVNGAKW